MTAYSETTLTAYLKTFDVLRRDAGIPEVLLDRLLVPAPERAVWAAVEEASRAALGVAASGSDSPRVDALYAGAARRSRALWIALWALALRYPPAPAVAAACRARHRAWLAGMRTAAQPRVHRRDRGSITEVGRLRQAERVAYYEALAASFDPDVTLAEAAALELASREAEARLRAALQADEAARAAAATAPFTATPPTLDPR